jgi:hypothetical protein
MIEVKDCGDYCELNSVFWENYRKKNYLADARAFYREFREIERHLIIRDFYGWAAYTKLDNPGVMRILRKVGAQPYRINLEFDSIWFYRRF